MIKGAQWLCKPRVGVRFPVGHQKYAGVAQLVEHNVANVEVVGSNPISRSNIIAPLVQWREYGATNAETGVRFSPGVPKE